jgi:hypothetical protein
MMSCPGKHWITFGLDQAHVRCYPTLLYSFYSLDIRRQDKQHECTEQNVKYLLLKMKLKRAVPPPSFAF